MRKVTVLSITLLLIGCSIPNGSSLNNVSNSSENSISVDAYDAVSIFALGNSSVAPLPTPKPGEVVINYGGWSLNQLLEKDAGKQFLRYAQDSYANETWADKALAPGIYKLNKEQSVPAVLMATALLAYRVQRGEINFNDTKKDALLLMVDEINCSQQKKSAGFVGLYWSEGKLYVDKDYCAVQGGGIWEAKM